MNIWLGPTVACLGINYAQIWRNAMYRSIFIFHCYTKSLAVMRLDGAKQAGALWMVTKKNLKKICKKDDLFIIFYLIEGQYQIQ